MNPVGLHVCGIKKNRTIPFSGRVQDKWRGIFFFFFFLTISGYLRTFNAAQTSLKHTDAEDSVCPVTERFKPAWCACAARSAVLSSGGPCRDAEDAEEADGCCGWCGGRTVLPLQRNWKKKIIFFSTRWTLWSQIVQIQKSTGAKQHPKPSKNQVLCVLGAVRRWIQ